MQWVQIDDNHCNGNPFLNLLWADWGQLDNHNMIANQVIDEQTQEAGQQHEEID